MGCSSSAAATTSSSERICDSLTLKKRLVITILLMVLIPVMLLMLLGASMYAAYVFGEPKSPAEIQLSAPPIVASDNGSFVVLHDEDDAFGEDYNEYHNFFNEQEFSRQMRPGSRLFGYVIVFGIAALVLIVASFACGVVYLSRKILPPMKELSRSARRISSGDLDFDILGSNIAEVQEVCTAFDEMRRRLRDQVAENIRYERERNLMLAHISHDLRTPVTAIKGYAEGLIDGVASTPDMQRRYAETIEQKAQTMERMIEQMSNFSELELGRMSFDFVTGDIFDYLRTLCDDFRVDLERVDADFEAVIPSDKLDVRLDPEKLGRVFQNILSNAIKYRSPERKLSVKLTAERTPTGVHIIISDNGRGIAQSDAEKVFEGFYRGDPARTAGAAGHGLGLAIARQIMQKHGGRIWITGRAGEGTDVHITLVKKEEAHADTDN